VRSLFYKDCLPHDGQLAEDGQGAVGQERVRIILELLLGHEPERLGFEPGVLETRAKQICGLCHLKAMPYSVSTVVEGISEENCYID